MHSRLRLMVSKGSQLRAFFPGKQNPANQQLAVRRGKPHPAIRTTLSKAPHDGGQQKPA